MAALSEAARKAIEMLPQGYQLQSEWARTHRARGEACGATRSKAEDILEVLDVRGLAITDEQRERIMGCTDLDTLRRWHRKAITAASADELFADDTE